MAKVVQKDISMALARKKGMDIADAERYVDTFFSLIEEALLSEKIVKVKGLGTFKLVEVRDRESVDVNTGDRVVIDGHAKVSFQPDPTLKELVNKPFSQFETVMLNEGVSFDSDNGNEAESAVDEAENSVNETEDSASEAEDPVNEAGKASADIYSADNADVEARGTGNEADKAVEENVKSEMGKSLIGSTLAEASRKLDTLDVDDASAAGNSHVPVAGSYSDNIPDSVTFSTSMDADNAAYERHAASGGTVANDKFTESTVPDSSAIPVTGRPEPAESGSSESAGTLADENPSKPGEAENAALADDEDDGGTGKKHSAAKTALCVAASVVALAAMFYAGYSMGESNKAEEIAEQKVTLKPRVVVVKAAAKKAAAVADTAARHDEPLAAMPEGEKAAQQAAEKEHVNAAAEDNAAPTESKKGDGLAEARREVKTGAYAIEGTDKTICLKPGQTLERISRTYLGEGMECYVIVHNGKTEFKPGESINIPKLRLKKKATNKKVS